MHTSSILGMVLATTALLLQGVPAPPGLAGVLGVVGARVAGGISAVAKAGKGKGKRDDGDDDDLSMPHVHRMALEIEAELSRRERGGGDGPPDGVLQHDWDACVGQARNASSGAVTVDGPVGVNNHIRVTGLPPACMNLAGAIGAIDNHTATPVPCGTDCVEYGNLSPGYYEAVRAFVNKKLRAGRGGSETRRDIRWSKEAWQNARGGRRD